METQNTPLPTPDNVNALNKAISKVIVRRLLVGGVLVVAGVVVAKLLKGNAVEVLEEAI